MGVGSASIELISGSAADALLADDRFRDEWWKLAAACPWATTFQMPGFGGCWYSVYRSEYSPLLVVARDGDGRLAGLLPLAVSTSRGELANVGAHQSEYHCWICTPELANTFMPVAMEALRLAGHKFKLSFRYLPGGTPVEWLQQPAARRTCLLVPRRRPLIDFGNGSQLRESMAKRSNKSRIKRLEKLGPVELKEITRPAELEAMIDEVILYYDSRRLALSGSTPFATDRLKRAYHIEMLKVPGLLHATALMCGDKIASFQFNTIDGRRVMLSLITHNPLLAAHSPGKVHVMLLSKRLMEQGYTGIDLTAGGDPYKERFANAWDQVYTLDVFHSPLPMQVAAIRDGVQGRAKAVLNRWNVRPAEMKQRVLKYVRMGPIGMPIALAKHGWERFAPAKGARIYRRDAAATASAEGTRIRRDAIEDLMKYEPVNGGLTRHEFLSDAMRRLENGQQVYTCVENGRLLHYAWFAPEPEKDLAADALPGFELPPRSALIVDCYTFPLARRRGLGAASLATILSDAARVKDLDRTYIAVPSESDCARRLVERAGFTYERSCVRRAP